MSGFGVSITAEEVGMQTPGSDNERIRSPRSHNDDAHHTAEANQAASSDLLCLVHRRCLESTASGRRHRSSRRRGRSPTSAAAGSARQTSHPRPRPLRQDPAQRPLAGAGGPRGEQGDSRHACDLRAGGTSPWRHGVPRGLRPSRRTVPPAALRSERSSSSAAIADRLRERSQARETPR